MCIRLVFERYCLDNKKVIVSQVLGKDMEETFKLEEDDEKVQAGFLEVMANLKQGPPISEGFHPIRVPNPRDVKILGL